GQMNRRSYVNLQTLRTDAECHWCHRTGQDVIAPNAAADLAVMDRARYECLNQRRCMKERGIRAAAARLVRELEQARAAELAQAGANACITGSCLTHRQPVYWQSSERRWVHSAGSFPCERDIFTAAPAPVCGWCKRAGQPMTAAPAFEGGQVCADGRACRDARERLCGDGYELPAAASAPVVPAQLVMFGVAPAVQGMMF